MTLLKTPLAALALSVALATPALAVEYPIGVPQYKAGMKITTVYRQPVHVEPEGMIGRAAGADIHIAANIRALANNPNGFTAGAWVPYLAIKFEVSKLGEPYTVTGELKPMMSNAGPHYCDNIKLAGAGRYRVKLTILPPSGNVQSPMGRHVDQSTGVRPWFKPVELEQEFTHVALGAR